MKVQKNSKVGRFLNQVMPGVIRPLHALWHEVIGFLFLVLAVILGSGALREIRRLGTEQGGLGRVIVSCFFPIVLAYFGITSFLRARKISRS